MPSLGARFIGGLLLTFITAIAAHAQTPKRVLMLHSFGPEFNDYLARDMRVQLARQLPGRLDVYEEWLLPARFANSQEDAALNHEDAAFARYLRDLFADHPVDLVITIGAPAANFVQRYQQTLFPTTPELLTDVEERKLASRLTPNETAVAISVSIPAMMENILRVQPRTSTVAVVIGNSPLEKYWAGQIRESLAHFNDRLMVTFLNDRPFSDVLKRTATLPAGSAILYIMLSPDVDGIPQDEDTTLAELHAVANAPIFSYTDAYLGKGIVGGPLLSGEQQARETIEVAARLLSGEHASNIKVPPVGFAKPQFDWRELKRWNIRESDLPPGSTILFHEPSVWERYRWQLLSLAAVLLLETGLIVTLLQERRRRRIAEIDAQRRMAELARVNRRSTVGALSASIVHELAQPLGASLLNQQEAESILEKGPPADFGELRDIIVDIGRSQRRANEVIRRLRSLLTKAPTETCEVDLNEVVREAFEFLSTQAVAHHVTLSTSLTPQPLLVSGDRIQLEQVLVNLIMNGIEAVSGDAGREPRIVGRVSVVDGTSAEVAIEDSGPGIPPDTLPHIFEPFFTTKDAGMGMGLSIVRTILMSHGGRISAENRAEGGAVFRFTIPLARTQRGEVEAPAARADSAIPRSQVDGIFDTSQ